MAKLTPTDRIARAYKLPTPLAARLVAHCMSEGDDPADVIADAVALHLDDIVGERIPDGPCFTPAAAAVDA